MNKTIKLSEGASWIVVNLLENQLVEIRETIANGVDVDELDMFKQDIKAINSVLKQLVEKD